MKRFILFIALLVSFVAFSQEKPVKIVFDVTSSDPATHQTAIRHVTLMSDSYPQSQFEVVLYSGSLDMALPDKSSVAEEVKALAARSNVSFKVCEATMRRHKVVMADLIPGVQTVPDGILEIVTRQQEGWGYIKEAKN